MKSTRATQEPGWVRFALLTIGLGFLFFFLGLPLVAVFVEAAIRFLFFFPIQVESMYQFLADLGAWFPLSTERKLRRTTRNSLPIKELQPGHSNGDAKYTLFGCPPPDACVIVQVESCINIALIRSS